MCSDRAVTNPFRIPFGKALKKNLWRKHGQSEALLGLNATKLTGGHFSSIHQSFYDVSFYRNVQTEKDFSPNETVEIVPCQWYGPRSASSGSRFRIEPFELQNRQFP